MEVKVVMNQVFDSFLKIIPYIYTDKLVLDHNTKASEAELTKNLTDIATALKSTKHVNFLKGANYKPSLDTINTHIQETIDSLQSKNKVFAQARLKAMTALCVSCHSQLSNNISKNAIVSSGSNIGRDRFDSDFGYANFLYLVRRFPDSVKYFEMAMKNNIEKNQKAPTGMLSDDKVVNGELYTSLRRVLSIYTKINFEPTKAIAFLNKYKNNKSISKFTKADIDLWIKSLEPWKKFDAGKVVNVSEFIKKNLTVLESSKEKVNSGDHDITLLISSGILSKYLSDTPSSDLTPEVLYWLAVAERRLSTTYFFSLSDIYLKECVTQYSKSEYAKKCYQEYEDNIIFGYSGSSGTDLPPEEKRELEKLKSLIK
jgi:hypothetical protein